MNTKSYSERAKPQRITAHVIRIQPLLSTINQRETLKIRELTYP
jgi:hypothetical protein